MALSGKKKHRRGSMFARYTTFFVAVEIISLVAFGVVLVYFVADTWEDEQKQKLLNYAENIATVYEEYLDADGQNGMTYSGLCYAISSVASASRADIYITDNQGNVILCRDMSDDGKNNSKMLICDVHSAIKIPGEIYTGILSAGAMATKGTLGGVYHEECFISAITAQKNYGEEPDGIVFAVQAKEVGLRPYLNNFLQIYIMAAMILILVTGLIMYVSTYTMTRPLREISEATKRYAKGDFSYRIPRDNGQSVREFDELAAAVNSMADDLEQLENTRTNFIANVSHELKTPMTTIGGFIDGILDGTIDREHQEDYLKIVSDEVKRLSRLVISMLNMSKMEAGELRINPSKFNLTQQILSIFLSFEQKIEDKDIHIKGLDSLTAHYIEADADMINQVFYNLIDNAVKFTQDGGEIGVFMSEDDEYLSVTIQNTGKGIQSEDVDHVFERFYKGDKSRSIDSKSAGLGLFIVKSIVTLHNGEITVNTDDKYTRFTVRLKARLLNTF